MIALIVRNTLRILFLVLIQGLVVNRIDLWNGTMLPFIYIFGILMLPINTPRSLLLVIAFATGALVDMFTNTLGLHISASLVLAFMQPLVQRALSPREGYEAGQRPTIQDMGLAWYVTYAGILTLIHHLWLFFIELFRFTPFFSTLGKVLLSTLATLLLLTIGQYLIYSPTDRRNQ
ncbi:MAG: hypothetical protein MK081_06785 [Flavobacteriales bacterium]|nr:hypothetical protein [Flavobacteriales bacterium]